MFWLVTGLKGSRFKEQLQENLSRLTSGGNHEVVPLVVLTGDVTWEDPGIAIREEKAGVHSFLFTAFQFLRQGASAEDWFVRIDADDYYGPGYLNEVHAAKTLGADATGIASVYVRDEEQGLYFCRSKRSSGAELLAGAPGGTLAGSMRKALDFPNTALPWGEDSLWCSYMQASGARLINRSSKGYAMLRWAAHEHTYPVAGVDLPYFWNCEPFSLGEWDEQLVNSPFDESKAKKLPHDDEAAIRGHLALKEASQETP